MKILYVCAGLSNPVLYPYGGAIEKLVGETIKRLHRFFEIELLGNIYGRLDNIHILCYTRSMHSIRSIPYLSIFHKNVDDKF